MPSASNVPSLKFAEVYALYAGKTEFEHLTVCCCPKWLQTDSANVPKGTPCLGWLDESAKGGHTMFVKVVSEKDGKLLLQELGLYRPKMADGDYDWVFAPLTEELWKELNRRKLLNLTGGLTPEMSAKEFKGFFISDLLEDWWVNYEG